MQKSLRRGTSGGKGGMFIERDSKVCAAGVPSAQPEQHVADCLKHYLLQEEAEALLHDTILLTPKPRKPLRHQPLLDMRNAGPFGEAAQLINPPVKTKFQTLVEDFKNTTYTSYWKKEVGTFSDPVPTLPVGMDIYNTTFGKKTPFQGRLYDILMPVDPVPETSAAKNPSYQTDRNYCKPSYNPCQTFGHISNIDSRGIYMKCCLTDDRVPMGTALKNPINVIQANFNEAKQASLGVALAPNNNVSCVPKGYTFGKLKPSDNLPECLTTCKMNPRRDLFKKCLAHFNTLRKCLCKRFDETFFERFYLKLKYFDMDKTGWLPKKNFYDLCGTKYIRFNPTLIEPLLAMWNAFDGSQIQYKTFVHVINYREPSPELPKVWDVPDDCIDFRTTYSEMTKRDQIFYKRLMAGVPSGRYLDTDYPITPAGCCKADNAYLPYESDARSCLCPSVFTLIGVGHRDMYANRKPETIRHVFEAAGERFSDEKFDAVWSLAKTYHSQGWVCYETFRRALSEIKINGVDSC